MKKAKFISIILVFCIIIGGASIWLFAKNDNEISEWERRKLQQFPEISYQALMNGTFMSEFESYVNDQFPLRDSFRRLKAMVLSDIYLQKDNNGIYIVDGYASEYVASISDEKIDLFTDKVNSLYETYIKGSDCNVKYAIVPDKNYFIAADNGYPAYDYDYVFGKVNDQLNDDIKEIVIKDKLSIEDYYTTDTHWKQESIVDIANYIRQQYGMDAVNNYTTESAGDFYGVYYGQSALDLPPDEIIYLENDEITSAEAYLYENDKTVPIYNMEKLEAIDHYDIFLSGAVSLIKISNPMGDKDKKLVVFRDSFGSSLTPLLMSGYSEIMVIDTRYINPIMMSRYVDFDNQDVLFLYSAIMVNSSNLFR